MIKERYDKRLEFKPLDSLCSFAKNNPSLTKYQKALVLIPSLITAFDTINVEFIPQP